MPGTGSSSADRRFRRRSPLHRALALVLSWSFAATSVWGTAPVAASPRPSHETSSGVALAWRDADPSSATAGAAPEARDSAGALFEPETTSATTDPAPEACDVTLWGPRRFTRTTGAPNVYAESVAVPPWVGSPYALNVVNGEPDGRRRVSSAWITVDGTQVAGPSDFSPQVASFGRAVSLHATSTLEIRLASAPNSFLQLGLCGRNADRTAPVVTWTAPADGSSSSDTTPDLALSFGDAAGVGEPGASGVDPGTLSVTLDGVERTALFVRRSGDASAELPAELALAQGPHQLVARVRDRAGNVGEGRAAFHVDSNPPRVVFAEPANGSHLRPPVRLQLVSHDDQAFDTLDLRVLVNGADRTSAFSRGATEATATLDLGSGLVEGPNQAEARVRDAAGNESTVAVAFSADTVPPQLVIVSPAAGTHQGSADVEVVVRYSDGQAVDPSSLTLSVDGVPSSLPAAADGANGWIGPLSDGPHRIAARVRDLAGNEASAEASFRTDTLAPALQIAQPAAGALSNTRTPDLLVVYSDADGVDTASLQVSVNGVDRTSLLTISPEAAYAALPVSAALADGEGRVSAVVKDLAGHETRAESAFTVDTIGPAITFGPPPETTNDPSPAVAIEWADAVSGVDPASARIQLDGVERTGLFALDVTRATGLLALEPLLVDGAHEIQVSVADRAGNVTARSRAFVLDTTPPAVVFESPKANAFVGERTPEVRIAWSDANGTGVDPASARAFLRRGVDPSVHPEIEITSSLQPGAEGARGRLSEALMPADDTYTLRVTVADHAGNALEAAARFEVDTVAPECTAESPVHTAVLGTTTPSFDLRCSDERSGIDPARLALHVDGVDRSARLSWAAGHATGVLAGDEALGQGAHTAELAAFDRAGNAAAIAAIAFAVDTTPPVIGVEQPAAGSFVSTPSPQLRATLADAGEAPSGIDPASVRAELDGIDASAAFPFAEGGVAGTLGPLADGPHVVVVRGADLGGNPATATAGFVVDTQPPAVREVSVADDAWIAQLDADGRLAISGQLDDLDPRLSVQCTVDGASVAATVGGGGFSCSPPLGEGTHSVEIDVTDGGGHTTHLKRTLNVDTTAPAVHVVDPTDGAYTNATSLTVTGTVVDRSPVLVSVSGAPAVVTGEMFVASGVPVGDGASATLTAQATDKAGNTKSHAVTLHVDRSAPTVEITRPRQGEALRSTAVPVEGTYRDDSPVSIVYVNGQLADLQPTDARQGRFAATVSVSDGALVVEAKVHDAAGNVGSASVSALVDATPPVVVVQEPLPGTVTRAESIRVAGRVSDDSAVTVTVGGQPAAVAGDGSFALTVMLAAQDGSQTITASAVDAVGNPASAAVDVVVDRIAPQLTIASPEEGSVVAALPVTVQGTAQDSTGVAVTVDGRAAALTGSAWAVTFDALDEGVHRFEAVATDGAGNTTALARQVQLDFAPPTVAIDQPASRFVTREASVVVAGTVTPPGANVTVNGVAATLDAGRFQATVTLAEGDNTIVALAQRSGSQRTGQDTILVTRDVTPPVVSVVAPEVVARERASRVSATVTDNVAVVTVELRLGALVLGRFTAPPYEADLTVPDGARSGDTLTLSVVAADSAGNTATATRGVRVAAAGVVVGQVLDAATGQPLAGASVRLLSGATAVTAQSDDRGRFSLPAEQARLALRAEREGFLSVDRQASVVSGVGNVVVDARLTALAAPVTVDASGGTLGPASAGPSEAPVSLQVPPGAVASASLRLTPLSLQALPGLLPLGFSPVAAFDVRDDAAAPLVQPLAATLASLPAGTLQLVAYRPSTRGWLVVARDIAVADGRAVAALPFLSTYALVMADAGEPAVAVAEVGQELAGGDVVAIPADARSSGDVSPSTLPPGGGTAEGRLAVATAAPLPSGTVVQAEVTETYTLASGEVASEERRVQDVVLFRGGAPDGAALAARFPITPSRTFDPVDLVEGRVHLDILAGREGVRGRTGGNDPLTLADGALALALGAGSLERDTAVALHASELSDFLPQAPGLTALREGVVDLSGARLSFAAELSIDAGVVPSGGTLLVARVERVDGIPNLVVVALGARAGDRIVSVAGSGLPGVREEGRYVFLRHASALGFVSGTVSSVTGPVPAVVSTDGLPFVFLAAADGRYIVPALAGDVAVSARPFGSRLGTTAPVAVGEGQTASLDLALDASTVAATVSPADGAVGVATSAQVEIALGEALDATTVSIANVRLLKGDLAIPVRLVLAGSGRRLAVVPQQSLEPAAAYTLEAAGLRTVRQAAVAVPRTRFTTRDDVAPAYDVDAIQFSFPTNGIVTVSAPAGSLPAGTSVLIIDSGNGVVLALSAGNDGALSGELPATIDDRLLVTVSDPAGKTTTFTRSQFRAEDGTTAIGPGGGTVTGAGGVELRVPEGATEKGVVLQVEAVDPASIPAAERPDFGTDAQGAPVAHLGAALKVSSPGTPTFKKEVDLAFPVPADAPEGSFFYVLRRLEGPDGRVAHETIDHAFVEGQGTSARVVTASAPYSGYTDFAGAYDASASVAKTAWNLCYLLWTFDQSLPGKAVPAVITGKVLREVWHAGAAATSYEPVPIGTLVTVTDASGRPLVDTNGAIVARSQADGTFTMFDLANAGGVAVVAASVGGQWRTATVYEMPADTRSPNLRYYRNAFTANVTFPAEAPPTPAPEVEVFVMDTPAGARRVLPNGLTVVGAPLLVGFKVSNGGLLNEATIEGQTLAVHSDGLARTEPFAMDYVADQEFTPDHAGTYTVTATVLPPYGSPIRAVRSFRVIGGGAGLGDALQNDPPAVIEEQTVPPARALSVSASAMPQLVFSEPVRNIPGHVRLVELPAGQPVDAVLSGVGPDAHGQLAVHDSIPDATAVVTSVTIQPRGGLKYATSYRIEVDGEVIDTDTDAAGNPAPKSLDPAPYVSEFTTFGPRLVGTTGAVEPIASPGLVLLGTTLFAVQNSFQNGTLRAYDTSDAASVQPLALDGDTFVWNRPVDIAGDGSTVVIATGPTNVSKPSNIFAFDVSRLPHVAWTAAAGLSNGAADGFIARIAVKDDRVYAATFRKGIQVVDLARARHNLQQVVGDQAYGSGYWDMLQQLNTDGRQFGPSAVVSTIPVRTAADQPARLSDLKAFDAVLDGQSQTLVAAAGDVGFVLADPQTGSVRLQSALVFADGQTRLSDGTALAVGPVAGRRLAVVAGSGVTGDPATPATLLGAVDLTVPEDPVTRGFLVLPEPIVDIALKGDLALATGTTRTYMVSLSDPSRPLLAGPAIEGIGGRLALGADGGALYGAARSLFGGVDAGSSLHTALLTPDANSRLLLLDTPVVPVEMTQDILNKTLCVEPGKLEFRVRAPAYVTVTLNGQPLVGTVGHDGRDLPFPIDGIRFEGREGAYTINVPPDLVADKTWDGRPFVIEARAAEDPAHVERETGEIRPDLRNRAVLPVGHTFVKGVDVLDGHVVRQSTDIKLPGRHLGLELTRSYSSAAQGLTGELGAGWSFNYAAAVTQTTCGLYVVSTADGSSQTFRSADQGQTFTPQKGYHTKLVRNGDGSYDFTDKAGNRHHFREPVDPLAEVKSYRLEYVEEPHGDRTKVTYDPLGRVSTVAEYQPDAGDVRRLSFTWTKAGGFDRVASASATSLVPTRDLALRVEYEYDKWGNLLRARRAGTNLAGESAAPRLESYAYTADDDRDRHQLIAATDPNGSRTEFEYYARTDHFPGEATNAWKGGIYVIDRQEHVKVVREYPNTGAPHATTFSYDFSQASSGVFLNTVTDARGNATLYTLNSYGAPTRIDEPLGRTTRFVWASDDIFKTSETDALGRETTYGYDARGNLTRETVRTADLGDVETAYVYDPLFNKLTNKVDAAGRETLYEISGANGDLLSTTDAAGNVTRYSYDDRGRLVSTTDPRGHVTTQAEFDSFGNARRTTDALGNTTLRAFDARGRLTSQSDSLGHRTETDFDAFDRPTRETRFACVAPCAPGAGIDSSRDAVTGTAYYAGGQPRLVTSPNGAATAYTLDGLNRVVATRTTLPEGGVYTTATTWDGNGNRVQETDRRGVTKAFHHDALNRLESTEIVGGSAGGGPYATIAAYGYDLAGNKTSERDVSGQTTRFELDGLYRVVRKVLPEGSVAGPYVESYAYDRVGNRLSVTDPNGHTSSWQYDGLNRVVRSRNALGQETAVSYADPEGSHVNKSEERDLVRGLRTTFAYDVLNRETRRDVHLEGAGGGAATYVTVTAHDDAAHAVRVTDPRGTTTLTRLDSLDRPVTTIVDETGLALETHASYDGLGNKQAVRDPNGNVTEWRLDGLGRQVGLTDALGHTASARYDGEGLKVEETDRRGVVTSFAYDSLGRPRRTLVMPSVTGNPWSQEVEYDDPGRRRTETDARHVATVVELDRIGREVRETDALGYAAETTWDGVNRRSTKDKNGNVTRYDYDALNRVTTTTDALGQTVVTTYDDANNLRLDKDRRGTLTRTQLDPLGRVARVTRAWSVAQQSGVDAETNTWDGNGNRVRQVDAEGHATQFEYDAANRLVRRTDGAGSPSAATTTYEYDATGNRTLEYDQRHSQEEPTVRSAYDALNRPVSTRDGEGNQTRHAYDPEGNKTSTTAPGGAVTTYAYDERGKLVRVTQPGNVETAYAYDENRNLVRQTDANGHVVAMTYDDLNRLRSTVQDAASGGVGLLTLHEYDPNGNETLLTDPKGQKVTSTWDELNRLKTRSWADAPGDTSLPWRHTSGTRYAYDPNGNLTQVDETVASGTDPPTTLTTTRGYDALDRLESETASLPDGGTTTVAYAYFGNGTRASVTDPSGLRTAYTYDAQNRLDSATTGSGTASAAVTRYGYYPDDLLREVTYPTGVRATHTYDKANRLVSLTNARATGAAVSAYVYSYDPNGNRLSQTETNAGRTETTAYTYDALDRLASVSYPTDVSFPNGRVVTYAYDRVGNRERETERDATGQVLADKQGIFDSLNRLVTLTDLAQPADDASRVTSFGWDPNGNQTAKTVGSGATAVTTQYVYDTRDKLVEVQQGSSILSRFQYDFEGRRTKKIGEEGLRQYVYDQTSLLAEYDAGGLQKAKYDYGSDRLISLTRTDEGRRYFSLDGLRSVVNLTDDSGSTVASYHLDAWGSFRFPSELNGSRNRFAFTGHIYDDETGLYNAKARYFDPKLGRFLTQDSYLGQIDEPPSLHRYLYANDNPTTFVDPTGHMADAATIKSDFQAARRDAMSPDERRAAAEQEKEASSVAAALPRELAKSISKRASGVAAVVLEATGSDKVLAVASHVSHGETLATALENVATARLDPKGRMRVARAKGAGIVEVAWQGYVGQVDAATDKMPIVGPLKVALDSKALFADRVEAGFDLTSQVAGAAAAGLSLRGGVGPSGTPASGDFMGPRIGRSGYITSEEFAQAGFERYQAAVDAAYTRAVAAESRGLLRGNASTRVGDFVDRFSAVQLRNWLTAEGLGEGPPAMVQMNRWLRDPAGSGLYVRPDIRIPGASRIFDATVGFKRSTDTQIARFTTFSNGDHVTIVRPEAVGGSYSVR